MAYTKGVAGQTAGGANDAVDLRSDTVTRPSPAMYEAMAEASLGDDVFGDDPTVNELEAFAAEFLGKQASVLLPSGTQSNLTAMLTHTARGEEIITGRDYHVYSNEAGGASALGGAVFCPLPVEADGGLDPDAVRAAVKPDNPHCPISRLLTLENTHNGKVVPVERMRAARDAGRALGLSTHLDGARLINAAVALETSAAELARGFDSVSLCLSKGLGAPAGTVLAGEEAFIARARRWRKMLGGGLRQAGLIAACGLVALKHYEEWIGEDHAKARRLAEGIADLPGFALDAAGVQSNMVFVTLEDAALWEPLLRHMAEAGVILYGAKPVLRLVVHRDVSAEGVERVLSSLAAFADEQGLRRAG